MVALREAIQAGGNTTHELDIRYITSRGNWYHRSWKGEPQKSGGIATNSGIHFFDMLTWIFGDIEKSSVHLRKPDCAAGLLQLPKASVRWFLSVNADHLPAEQKANNQRTYRSIGVDGQAVEFSGGVVDLHTASYEQILAGHGYGLETARNAVATVYRIRNAPIAPLHGDYHPFCHRAQ